MKYKKWSKKDRRHSGWVYPRSTVKCTRQFLIDNCLEPILYWDNWGEIRDGFRDNFNDCSKIRMDEMQLCDPPYVPRTEQEAVLIKLFGEDEVECESCRVKRLSIIKQKMLLKRRKLMKSKRFI